MRGPREERGDGGVWEGVGKEGIINSFRLVNGQRGMIRGCSAGQLGGRGLAIGAGPPTHPVTGRSE